MRANFLHSRVIASAVVAFLVCTVSHSLARPQDKDKKSPDAGPPEVAKKLPVPTKDALGRPLVPNDKVEALIGKMIADYDLKPKPLPEIPDSPPPHEGAMISLPHVLEPPDLVIVEVLEALPGQPISGERLVRPDGKISLGFYGDIEARGLTLEQLKVAIIKHLRRILTDEALGLRYTPPEAASQGASLPQARPAAPQKEQNPGTGKARSTAIRSDAPSRSSAGKSPLRRRAAQPIPIRLIRSQTSGANVNDDRTPPSERQGPVPMTSAGPQFFGTGPGRITITIDIGDQRQPIDTRLQPGRQPQVQEPNQPAVDEKQAPGQKPPDQEPIPQSVEGPDYSAITPPAESDTVFVDMTGYNSSHYYILGDVVITGKLPCTGNETVLDALQYAGGLLSTAEPKDIRLLRPGRNGKPSRVYKVDLEAIQEKGDLTTNYQIFGGDRLIVGRNEVVKRTVELDRIAAPLSTVTNAMQRLANSIRSLQEIDPADADLIMKELTDFWVKELSRKGDLQFDEATLREALLQRLKERAAPKNKPK